MCKINYDFRSGLVSVNTYVNSKHLLTIKSKTYVCPHARDGRRQTCGDTRIPAVLDEPSAVIMRVEGSKCVTVVVDGGSCQSEEVSSQIAPETEVAKVCNCRRERGEGYQSVLLSPKTKVAKTCNCRQKRRWKVTKACNCRRKRRWRLPKCVTIAGIEIW